MNSEITDFIAKQRTCVIAVEMLDGSPHAATVHFAHNNEPFTLLIQTNPEYRKAEPLQEKTFTRVSVVIGTTEEPDGKDKTFQLDGAAQIIQPDSVLSELYYKKFPEKRGKWQDDIFFTVSPTWWRYTEWGKSEGKTIFYSDGTVLVNGILVK